MNGQSTETQWYIARDGKQHGPLTDIEMRTFVAHNYLRPSDLIWRPGMSEWQLAPTLFPAVFPNIAGGDPQSATAASAAASAQSPMPSSAAQQKAAERTQPSSAIPTSNTQTSNAPSLSGLAGQRASDAQRQPLEPMAERSVGKRLAIAAVAITVIGGGAFALANYREPLMRLVGGDAPTNLSAAPPTVEATSTAAETATSSSVDLAAQGATQVETQAGAPPQPTDAAAGTADANVTASTTTLFSPSGDVTIAATPQPITDATSAASPQSPSPTTDPNQIAAVAPNPTFDGSASGVVATTAMSPPSIAGSTIDARLQKIPAWTLIKKDYPDWYVTNIAAAEQLVAEQKPATEVSSQIAQSLVSLRRQNADKALAASTEKLRRIAVAFLENLKALRSQSVTACYGFISKGETSPSVVQLVDTPDGPTAFHGQIGAIFEAIAEGTKSPQQHPPAVKADYDLLIKELSKLGWKEEDLQVFSNPRLLAKREPERVCSMVQEWFVAHLAVPDKAARDRLLFETLKPVISG